MARPLRLRWQARRTMAQATCTHQQMGPPRLQLLLLPTAPPLDLILQRMCLVQGMVGKEVGEKDGGL